MKVTVKYTQRADGNGKPLAGFYVIVNGIPISCPWKTYEAAYAARQQYEREVQAMVTR